MLDELFFQYFLFIPDFGEKITSSRLLSSVDTQLERIKYVSVNI